MVPVRRIVLDVLKPHEPELVEFSQRIGEIEGVQAVNATLIELDRKVQNVRLTVEGEGLEYDTIQPVVDELGATVHSIDEVACGEYIVLEPSDSSLVHPSWLR